MKNQIKLAIMTALILVSSVACDNGGSVIQDAQNDINAATSLVEQTVTVSTGMVKNTVQNGCGFATATLPECQ